jgi:hypothetical protein
VHVGEPLAARVSNASGTSSASLQAGRGAAKKRATTTALALVELKREIVDIGKRIAVDLRRALA